MENDTFAGFSAISDFLKAPADSTNLDSANKNMDDKIPYIDPDKLMDLDDKDDDIVNDKSIIKKDKDSDDLPEPLKDAIDKIDSKSKKEIKEQPKEEDDEPITTKDVDNLGEYESDIVDYFSDEFSKELGWELSDEEKPKSVKDVVNMIRQVVEENSVPQYADERVKNLDEFLHNGGKWEDYVSTTAINKIDLENIDIEKEQHQKAILTEHLLNTGYKESAIEKKIKRWEDAGVLQEEAEEALENVKEYRKETEKKLLDDQRRYAQQVKQQQQKFFSDVDETIKNMKDVRGVTITDKVKRELIEYIFKPDSEGVTQYQRDYSKNVKNLIESAYFTKYGDSLIKNIEKSVETKAAKTLKEKLANSKGNRGIDQSQRDDNTSSMFDTLSSQFLLRK